MKQKDNIAVLLTVYNRKNVTVMGLRSLSRAIKKAGEKYSFDIYMTDDGSTDGTSEAVKSEFSSVNIVNGDGTLFWGGGMRKAWTKALESKKKYSFFLWFNDDSILEEDAILNLLNASDDYAITVGSFCNKDGIVSYGGKIDGKLVVPNGMYQEIDLMNGNLVLIPYTVYKEIGMIDKRLRHGEGDYDYGLRAKKKGYRILLSTKFVGQSERHDEYIPRYCLTQYGFLKRWKILHAPLYSPQNHFIYNARYSGLLSAILSFLVCYIGVCFPKLYVMLKSRKK